MNPHIAALNILLEYVNERKASDLLLTPGQSPVVRIDGSWRELEDETFRSIDPAATITALAEYLDAKTNEYGGFDAAYEAPDKNRYRLNAFRHTGRTLVSHAIVLRRIPSEIGTPLELGLPPILNKLADKQRGLILITGPTGEGKSTTLASLLHLINQRHAHHIITLEDPVEFRHRSLRSIVHQREVGVDTESYAMGLREALRQSPNVIMVAELRDEESIRIAVTAAETGHLVLGTLHTHTALDTVNRIVDTYPGGQQDQVRNQLANTLQAVISQILLPQYGGGRCVACEVLVNTPAVANNIRGNTAHHLHSAMQAGSGEGMITLDQSLAKLFEDRRISQQAALNASHSPTNLKGILGIR